MLSAPMVSSRDGVPFLTAGELNNYFFAKHYQYNACCVGHCEKHSKLQECSEAKSSLFADLLPMRHIIRSREKHAVLFNCGMNLLKLLLDL
jgi:hypothetical protein